MKSVSELLPGQVVAGIKFQPANQEAALIIASNLREADKAELLASTESDPREGVTRSIDVSDYCSFLWAGGEPIAVIGLRKNADDSGIPWMLGTNRIQQHKVSFFKACKKALAEMLLICPRLWNFVYEDSKSSIRFLRRLGFEIGKVLPIGANGENFHLFHVGETTNV